MITPQHVKVIIYIQFNIWLLTKHIIPLYNIYSTCIEIRLVETIPRDIYQNIVFPLNNIVFPSQQYRISLIRNSQDLTLWSYNGISSRDVPK